MAGRWVNVRLNAEGALRDFHAHRLARIDCGAYDWSLPLAVTADVAAGKNVEERARDLMSLPPIKELDLPCAGKPARRLMAKLGLAA